MDYIVLVKQVPDVANIPTNAWDKEKGTLIRSVLDSVLNPLDLHALTFAYNMKKESGDKYSKVIGLTMGPNQAKEVLYDILSRYSDEAVLLTDRAFAGADTVATSYSLAQAIRKIENEIIFGKDYIILSGMQSVDGDTAQVPPQIAEELGIEHIAYAQSFSMEGGRLMIKRIGPFGMETVMPKEYPLLITTTACTEPLYKSFHRARKAQKKNIHIWTADSVKIDKNRVGLVGSRTQVYRIYSPQEDQKKNCQYIENLDLLVDAIDNKYKSGSNIEKKEEEEVYSLDGRTPTYKGEVWAYVEQEGGKINPVSLELISKAAELAKPLNEKVGAVLVGKNVENLAETLIQQGADRVYLSENDSLESFLPIPYKKVVSELVLKYKPQIMLFGATPLGRELAPRVAYATDSGLTADCTKLEISDHKKGKEEHIGILKQTRPALGGNIMATIMTKDADTQMASVRPGVMVAKPLDANRKGEVIKYEPSLSEDDFKSQIISIESFASKISLADAEIIVSGGRGLGTKSKYDNYIRPLASAFQELINGKVEVGASRMAVEDGFIDHDHQVGQTGQTVKPRLYVAVGISGAVQHISGMQNSDIIIAINKDPKAKIFKHADFGIVGDLEQVIPKLVEAIKRKAK